MKVEVDLEELNRLVENMHRSVENVDQYIEKQIILSKTINCNNHIDNVVYNEANCCNNCNNPLPKGLIYCNPCIDAFHEYKREMAKKPINKAVARKFIPRMPIVFMPMLLCFLAMEYMKPLGTFFDEITIGMVYKLGLMGCAVVLTIILSKIFLYKADKYTEKLKSEYDEWLHENYPLNDFMRSRDL